MPEPDLVGSVEAAEIIGIPLPTLKRRARSGALPHVIKMRGDTGAYLFDRSVVEAYRDEMAAAS